MGNDQKFRYKQHIRDTAPDMEMLWNRIESEIDKTEERPDKSKAEITESYENKNNRRITSSRLAERITAAAAAIAVIIGVGVFYNTRVMKTKDSNDTTPLPSQAEQAETEAPSGVVQGDGAYEANDETNEQPIEDDHEAIKKEASGKAEFTETDGAEPEAVERTLIHYSSLSFQETTTVAYREDYEAAGDEYFVEDKVLDETDAFIDVTVLRAELTEQGGVYSLQVNNSWTRDGQDTDTDLTIRSTTPYILQEGREYLIPLRNDGGSWYLAFENAPQIEITLDKGAVFQNGWSISSEADVQKDELGANDFYYDRMCYCQEQDLEEFIQGWLET